MRPSNASKGCYQVVGRCTITSHLFPVVGESLPSKACLPTKTATLCCNWDVGFPFATAGRVLLTMASRKLLLSVPILFEIHGYRGH